MMLQASVSLFISILLHVTGGTVAASNYNDSNILTSEFWMYNNVSKPTDTSECSIKMVSAKSRFRCVDVCAKDDWCASVFAEMLILTNDTNKGENDKFKNSRFAWKCYVCENAWNRSLLTQGNGYYAIAKFQLRALSNLQQPEMSGTEKEGIQLINGQVTAVYSCLNPPRQRILLAYNKTLGQFPEMVLNCELDMCFVESFRNTVLDVADVGMSGPYTLYHAYPICADGERPHGYAWCTWGGWIQYDNFRQMCIPEKCQKISSAGIPAYAGTMNTTRDGYTCQRWDKTSPTFHTYNLSPELFLLDDKNVSLAGNFCRSFGEPYLWCWVTDPLKLFSFCEPPICRA